MSEMEKDTIEFNAIQKALTNLSPPTVYPIDKVVIPTRKGPEPKVTIPIDDDVTFNVPKKIADADLPKLMGSRVGPVVA